MNTPSFNATLLSQALQLLNGNLPFAWATVVRASPPSSAYVGAQAIVTADGTLHGWVGGGCARDIVVQSCLDAIRTRSSKLVRISNDGGVSDADAEHYAMPCASNGALDLFIQPVNPAPVLYIAGATPAAKAAQEFAAMLGWRVLHGDPTQGTPPPDYVLVATQGDDDINHLERALRSPAKKVLLIASTRKAKSLNASMQYVGISEERLADMEGPAGPDILAKSPAEVALAAVAGLVRAHRQDHASASGPPPLHTQEASRTSPHTASDGPLSVAGPVYVNPVCLRPIDPATALHTISIGNAVHYFCCDGCKIKFEADPKKYLQAAPPALAPRAR